jgi:hypothetical protein
MAAAGSPAAGSAAFGAGGDADAAAGPGALAGDPFEHRDQRPRAHLVADLDLHLGDDARGRRRHLHCRLVTLEHEQRVVLLDGVACFDEELDDGDLFEVPDVRNLYFSGGQASLLES